MSFDLTKRHLKADIARRAVIDSTVISGLDQSQPQKQAASKPKPQAKGKPGQKVAPKAAAKPASKEYNPYIAAIDNSSTGKIKAFKKQLKAATGQIATTSSRLAKTTSAPLQKSNPPLCVLNPTTPHHQSIS
jgi:hypothetical protein